MVASTLHGNPRVWTVPEFPAPIPGWVCDLAQALTGGIVGEVDSASSSGQPAVKQTERFLRQLDPSDPYVRWGRWFLHRETNRTISAFSEIRIEEYQDAQLQRRDIFAAHRVLLRRPSQLRALAVIPRNRILAGIEASSNATTKHGQQRAQLVQAASTKGVASKLYAIAQFRAGRREYASRESASPVTQRSPHVTDLASRHRNTCRRAESLAQLGRIQYGTMLRRNHSE